MKIGNFVHKGLEKLYHDGNAKGVPADTVDKLRKMFGFLGSMEHPDELRALTAWKAHTLTAIEKASSV